uniref:Solute carrier family 25 member 15 n=1 Tax=Stegastes partitus TaxID=144197 RepID=A0A3B5AXY8_9TELE
MAPHPVVQAIVDFSAGATACVLSGKLFDTTKVKMQMFPSMLPQGNPLLHLNLQAGGTAGLYKSTTLALSANISENAVLFLSYGLWMDKGADLSDLYEASAGSLPSILSFMALCPTELVKCRLQAMREMETSGKLPVNCGEDGVDSKPSVGFYGGLTCTIVRESPGYFFSLILDCFGELPKQNNVFSDILPVMFSGGFEDFGWPIQVYSLSGRQEGFMKTFMGITRTERRWTGPRPTLV